MQRNNLMNFPVPTNTNLSKFRIFIAIAWNDWRRSVCARWCEFVNSWIRPLETMLRVSELGIPARIVLVAETNQAFLEKKNRTFLLAFSHSLCVVRIFFASIWFHGIAQSHSIHFFVSFSCRSRFWYRLNWPRIVYLLAIRYADKLQKIKSIQITIPK